MTVTAQAIEHQPIRGLKRAEYDRLIDLGVFGEDERLELVFGQVVQMSPIGNWHHTAVRILNAQLTVALAGRAGVSCQGPFAATDDSEPQPDIYVTDPEPSWNAKPSRAYLVIEVAQSSLEYDRGEKAALYAQSAVEEYWIVDLENMLVEVRREARDGQWRSIQTFRRGEAIAMLAFPDVLIAVADVLPPV
jgi:Uma2 family endonuclease